MPFLSDSEQEKIKQSIEWAEKETSGEIRVCLEKKCKAEVLDRAVACFYDLGMEKTKLRNGVLIYVAYADRKFAIIGDKGINNLIANDFWDTTKNKMLHYFSKGEMAEGISIGIIEVGKQLKAFFPYHDNDTDELSNDIVFLKD